MNSRKQLEVQHRCQQIYLRPLDMSDLSVMITVTCIAPIKRPLPVKHPRATSAEGKVPPCQKLKRSSRLKLHWL